MSQARDLLSLLLSTSSSSDPSSVPLPPGALTASSVSKLPAISSVQSFNARLVTGGKDEALRKASDVLKAAAEGVERGSAKSDKFWTDALSIRKSNWGLIPAPLPLGSAMGKGADKTSKDFLVSFGLEQCESLVSQIFCVLTSSTKQRLWCFVAELLLTCPSIKQITRMKTSSSLIGPKLGFVLVCQEAARGI